MPDVQDSVISPWTYIRGNRVRFMFLIQTFLVAKFIKKAATNYRLPGLLLPSHSSSILCSKKVYTVQYMHTILASEQVDVKQSLWRCR